RLEANGKMDVYYEITIPENIEPGSYWNVVMVEPVDDIKPDESKGVKVNTVVRYAVLLVTTTMDAVAEAKIIFKSVNLTNKIKKISWILYWKIRVNSIIELLLLRSFLIIKKVMKQGFFRVIA